MSAPNPIFAPAQTPLYLMIKLVECPRDAMQGIKTFIPTAEKAAYLNALLQVGFDTLDFGSFVSPGAIPQMRDTAEVLDALQLDGSPTQLLAIVANRRGAEDAARLPQIRCLGYPFSISETFQLRNTNATIAESLARVGEIQEICLRHQKELVIYISMGFGNPYGDPWNVDIVQHWVDRLADMGIRILSLSDTVGVATPETISYLFGNLIPPYPEVEFGAHLHTQPHNWREKIEAAHAHGCKRFDAALKGFGGCPMAKDDLTGNMPTENLLSFFEEKGVPLRLDPTAFDRSMRIASELFARYA
jgi:hydroxymethylglutaryl-CoA lyase